MDAIVLTWRWQNVLSIGIIVVGWFLLVGAIGQIVRRTSANANA